MYNLWRKTRFFFFFLGVGRRAFCLLFVHVLFLGCYVMPREVEISCPETCVCVFVCASSFALCLHASSFSFFLCLDWASYICEEH